MGGILHVCTGNVRRSPIAELIMRERLRQRLGDDLGGLAVSSAGLDTDPGLPASARVMSELKRDGVRPGPFSSRPLTPQMVAGADLVLTASHTHRDDIVFVVPAASHRVFTWREMVGLVHDLRPEDVHGTTAGERVRALAEVAGRRRRGALPREGIDVRAPHGLTRRQYRAAIRVIDEAVAVLVDVLAPPVGLAVFAQDTLARSVDRIVLLPPAPRSPVGETLHTDRPPHLKPR